MKYLVLGATGMAGHVITMVLCQQGHQVTALSRRKYDYCENVILDVFDKSALEKELAKDYDVVINCVGVLNKDCDLNPDIAVYINSYLPHQCVSLLKETKTRFFHISSDCVFSGKRGQYREDDLRDGSSLYARTKALGEIEDDKNLTIRTSIVGPDTDVRGIGLYNWFRKQEGEIHGYTKVIWTGITTITLAKAIEKASMSSLTGLINLVNNKTVNKYELLRLFAQASGGRDVDIIPDDTFVSDKSLVDTRGDFKFIVPDYEDMITEMNEWVEVNKHLYPHY